jgi:hypothetical protein
MLNTLLMTLPLALGLAFSALYGLPFPESVIIPTVGGGLMNLGFWYFYPSSIEPIPELRKSILARSRAGFLLVGILHAIAIMLLLVLDLRWVFELLPFGF